MGQGETRAERNRLIQLAISPVGRIVGVIVAVDLQSILPGSVLPGEVFSQVQVVSGQHRAVSPARHKPRGKAHSAVGRDLQSVVQSNRAVFRGLRQATGVSPAFIIVGIQGGEMPQGPMSRGEAHTLDGLGGRVKALLDQLALRIGKAGREFFGFEEQTGAVGGIFADRGGGQAAAAAGGAAPGEQLDGDGTILHQGAIKAVVKKERSARALLAGIKPLFLLLPLGVEIQVKYQQRRMVGKAPAGQRQTFD